MSTVHAALEIIESISTAIYTTIGDARACVCVCKIGPISARTL